MILQFDEAQAREFFNREFNERYIKTNRRLSFFSFAVAFLLSLLSVHSNGAEFFTYAYVALAGALMTLGFYLTKVIAYGVRFRLQGLIFLPWLIFLLLEVFCGNAPWETAQTLYQNLFVFFGFFFAMQCARSDNSQFQLLATCVAVAVLTITGGIFYRLYYTTEATVGNTILGFFNSAEQLTLLSLFIFFASLVLVLYPRTNTALKLLGIYSALFAVALIFGLGDMAAIMAFFAGTIVLIAFFVRKKILKPVLILSCVIGFFLTPKFTDFDALVFCDDRASSVSVPAENVPATRPLIDSNLAFPRAALNIFKAHPIFGSGTGTFGEQYANYAPADAKATCVPKTCGSLPLQLLAENGLAGTLLLLVPALGLLIFGIKKISHTKFFDDSEDARAFEMRQRPLTAERVLTTCAAAGLVAFCVVVSFSYEITLAGLFLPFAIFAGTLFREALPHRRVARRSVPAWEERTRRALSLLLPIGLVLFAFPITQSSALTYRADNLLRPYCHFVGQKNVLPANVDNLYAAHELYLFALGASNGENLRAWQGLTKTYLAFCNYNPQRLNYYLAHVQECVHQQMIRAPQSANVQWQKGLSQVLCGNAEEAKSYLQTAQNLAPRDIALLMNLGEAWRKISITSPEAKSIYQTLHERFPNNETIGIIYAGLQLVAPENQQKRSEKSTITEIEI